jgi:spore maturation protein CgeB
VRPRSSTLDIVVIGLAITSSWGNGHATTYRSLLRGLHTRGHRVLFLEQDRPWYAKHRDLSTSAFWQTELYADVEDLRVRFAPHVKNADVVIVGSYVAEGREVCEWVVNHARGVRAFYDIDTPVTLRGLSNDACPYLAQAHVPAFDLFLSFTGGPTLETLERELKAQRVRALYCSVDVEEYTPLEHSPRWAMGYMGTYSADRQSGIEQLLNAPARTLNQESFIVVGAQYPDDLHWPVNVERRTHLPPPEHAWFYAQQRFTLNITRADMRAAGYSPSVRLFEAGACGVAIISDAWPGLAMFFVPDVEILLAHDSNDVCEWLRSMNDVQRRRLGAAARQRVLQDHSSLQRAAQLEAYIASVTIPNVSMRPKTPARRLVSGRAIS